jgi:hypothetical protein
MDEEKILEKIYNLDARINSVEKMQAVTHTEFVQIKGDLSDIKGSITWVTRLIIGALILALIGFMLSGGSIAIPNI